MPGSLWAVPSFRTVEPAGVGITTRAELTDLVRAPSSPETLYVSARTGEVFRSDDEGKTWRARGVIPAFLQDLPTRKRLATELTLRPGGYADPHGWPQERWRINNPSSFLRPQTFQLDSIIPDPQLLNFSEAGQINRLFRPRTDWLPPEEDVLRASPRLKIFGESPLDVRRLAVNPRDPEHLLAATDRGVWESLDGAASWRPFFRSAGPRRRSVRVVDFHPMKPELILIGTDGGLLRSIDDGRTVLETSYARLRGARCTGIGFSPIDPERVWISSTSGLFLSRDQGRSYTRVFRSFEWGKRRTYRPIASPTDPDVVVFHTEAYAFATFDGGESFQEMELPVPPGTPVKSVAQGSDPAVLFVATERDVWESQDGGISWQAVFFGSTTSPIDKLLMADPAVPGDLWMLTGRSLSMLRMTSAFGGFSSESRRELERLTRTEPSLDQAIQAALRAHGAELGAVLEYADGATSSRWLPTLQVTASRRRVQGDFATTGVNFGPLDPALATNGSFQNWQLEAMGLWDLSSIVFARDELPNQGLVRARARAARSLREEVSRLYIERRRLQMQRLFLTEGGDLRSLLHMRTRIEELTWLLNALTDDLFRSPSTEEPSP